MNDFSRALRRYRSVRAGGERGRVLESEDCQRGAEVVPVANTITSELRGVELRGTRGNEEENGALDSTSRCFDAFNSTNS